MDLTGLFTWESLIAFITLVALELVLGVDNVIFISILAGKLPPEQQDRARTTGILAAVITRVLLLLSLNWIIQLNEPLFSLLGWEATGQHLILLAGGLFLLWKSTREIHDRLEGVEGQASAKVAGAFWSVVIQIMLLDIVFSLDSVITAVGMANEIAIMVAAVIIAAVVMVFTSGPLSHFVERHPTIKMLALSFLLLIGFTLVLGGFDKEVDKKYIYFAMGFSVLVEMLNLRARQERRPVNLRDPYKAVKMATEGGPAVEMPMPAVPKKKVNQNKKRKGKK
ncbi:MAG: TerC family protein [Chloroflexota bacterium]|nr:TerC family protein [Anaerolineales bacterium]